MKHDTDISSSRIRPITKLRKSKDKRRNKEKRHYINYGRTMKCFVFQLFNYLCFKNKKQRRLSLFKYCQSREGEINTRRDVTGAKHKITIFPMNLI